MAGPSTEFMRGLERDYKSWSPMTSWRPMAGRAPAASGSTQESVIEAAIPQDQRGCETTSNWWPVSSDRLAHGHERGRVGVCGWGPRQDPGGRTTETASPSPRPCAPDLRSRASPLPQAHRQCATRAHARYTRHQGRRSCTLDCPLGNLCLAMPESVLQQIEADIAEAERLMTELRLRIAMSRSAGEETTKSERRLQDILKGWMLLQDQRQKAAEAAQRAEKANQTTSGPATNSGLTASKDGQADPAVPP